MNDKENVTWLVNNRRVLPGVSGMKNLFGSLDKFMEEKSTADYIHKNANY